MVLSYKIFGINEFSSRLASAVLGLLSIVLIYKIAILLFNKKLIGFVSGLILGTSAWYLMRVRSGNLDSVFVFFYLLTVYSSLKVVKNPKWLMGIGIAFAGLIMSKTLIGFSCLPLIIYLNFKQIINFKKNYRYIIGGLLFFILIAGAWYLFHILKYPSFFFRHFITIGTRNKTLISYFKLNIQQPFFYIHMGVRKWYYLWFLGVGYIILSLKFLKKRFFLLLLWSSVVLYPFLTSEKTELWHLIPVYSPMALIIASGTLCLIEDLSSLIKKLFREKFFVKKVLNSTVINIFYLAIFILMSLMQIKNFYKDAFSDSRYIPDDVDISMKVSKYNKKIILNDDFLPIAVYYSGKRIIPINSLSNDKQTLIKLYNSTEKNFIVMSRNWAVDDLEKENISYKLLEKNSSFSITTR
jgi:4-amino-4-deoxy-L-arabinose transferase-like glycosyltransferase